MTDHHQLMHIISTVIIFVSIAGIVVPLLQKIKISPVLSYLICGILIGPHGLAKLSEKIPWLTYITINETSTVNILGELGIITLMFMIGLKLSFSRLKDLKHYILGLGTAQILISALIIFAIALMFEHSIQASILIGASFALSSTAIVMKLLEERKLINQPVGVLCFAILLMQDLAVVPILVLASSFSGDSQTNIIATLSLSLALGVVAVFSIYIIGKYILTPLFRSISVSNTAEWLAAFVVFLALACSILTYVAGLSFALGAFMAGLLIAETEFRQEVEVVISPIKGLLLGIFFLSVGMMVDLQQVLHYPLLLPVSIVGIYLIKAVVLLILCLAFKLPGRIATETAFYLAQPGEFALMILGVAITTNLLPAHDVQFYLLVTVAAMMISPLLFKLAPIAGEYGGNLFSKYNDIETPTMISEPKCVVIAGFGRMGKYVAEVFKTQNVTYLAFDNDGKLVNNMKKNGYNILYGDARKKGFWQQLIDKDVKAIVIATDNHAATESILKSVRNQFENVSIIVRAKDTENLKELFAHGADFGVSETLESSLRIAEMAIERVNSHATDTSTVIEEMRANDLED